MLCFVSTFLFYITTHLRCLRLSGSGLSTALTASSNTCLSPRCVNAEHSMYLTARILFANFWPCSRLSGDNPCSASAFSVSRSSRKSIFVPTRIIGASGQWCFISGYHFDVTFSNEEGLKKSEIRGFWFLRWFSFKRKSNYLATLKQIRKTSVCGYESGLNLS